MRLHLMPFGRPPRSPTAAALRLLLPLCARPPRAAVALSAAASAPRTATAATISTAAASVVAGARVGYVTDVEGNLPYWRDFCALSEVVDDSGGLDALALADDTCHLVVGGDSVDKGPGDLRFLRSVLTLKERYPDRVHLVLGNRDINKMRLLAELSDAHWLRAKDHPGVYWRRYAGPGGGPATPETFLASQPDDDERGWTRDTTANRLRYMLADNMGSPRAFEFRRAELAELAELAEIDGGMPHQGPQSQAPSDADVLRSFQDSVVMRGGLMRRYLEEARLAVRIGDALFVHGGIQPGAIGHVPAARQGGAPSVVEDVDDWISALNEFAKGQVREWCADCDRDGPPSWPGADDRDSFGFFDRPGGQLLAYGMATRPDGTKSPTVVYSSFLNDGHPEPARTEVVRWLAAAGIRALVVGHQPHGDSPVLMRCGSGDAPTDDGEPGPELIVVTADTSFSGFTKWEDSVTIGPSNDDTTAPAASANTSTPPPSPPVFGNPRGPPPPIQDDPRGAAVVEVRLDVSETNPCVVRVHGVLSDGRKVDCSVGDGAVGCAVADGKWWVKAQLEDGTWLLSRGEGYDAINGEIADLPPHNA